MDIKISNFYRYYVLGLLTFVFTLNFLDRQLMAVLVEPIKLEFALTDTHMGILTGIAFALLYTTLGFPIARIADRGNRVGIIALALFVWSFFTFLTGFARGYWHLFLYRVGVGIGEAGCTPPSYSIISDYFPKEQRGRAISIYSLGVPIGVFLGLFFGGLVAQNYGWRMAFYIAGLPGIIGSFLVYMTIKTLPRGHSDQMKDDVEQLPFVASLKKIMKIRSFIHMSIAAGLHALISYGIGAFIASFLIRAHHLNVGEVGTSLAFLFVFGAGIGTYYGGALADRLSAKTGLPEYYLWIPAISTLIWIPSGIAVVYFEDINIVFASIFFSNLFGQMFWGPTAALSQRLAPLRERGFVAAMLLFVVNFLGLGIGPVFVGFLSNLFRDGFVAGGMVPALADAEGLRYAIIYTFPIAIWCAIHYFLACRTLKADLAAVELSK